MDFSELIRKRKLEHFAHLEDEEGGEEESRSLHLTKSQMITFMKNMVV